MTRLRMPERHVLDTLVDAGVARSRSHALAWCVRLVSERQEEWLADLREAMKSVEEVRKEGPARLTAAVGFQPQRFGPDRAIRRGSATAERLDGRARRSVMPMHAQRTMRERLPREELQPSGARS